MDDKLKARFALMDQVEIRWTYDTVPGEHKSWKVATCIATLGDLEKRWYASSSTITDHQRMAVPLQLRVDLTEPLPAPKLGDVYYATPPKVWRRFTGRILEEGVRSADGRLIEVDAMTWAGTIPLLHRRDDKIVEQVGFFDEIERFVAAGGRRALVGGFGSTTLPAGSYEVTFDIRRADGKVTDDDEWTVISCGLAAVWVEKGSLFGGRIEVWP